MISNLLSAQNVCSSFAAVVFLFVMVIIISGQKGGDGALIKIILSRKGAANMDGSIFNKFLGSEIKVVSFLEKAVYGAALEAEDGFLKIKEKKTGQIVFVNITYIKGIVLDN